MQQTCSACGATAVRDEESIHNVVYVCPDCGTQLDVVTAGE